MPFPWKKIKSTKVSRFVNDHLHNSQKRRDGSSLVVETGFPTSLIDLFIKNREKWNKPSKKKPGRIPDIPPIDVNDQVLSECPTPYPPPSPSPSRVVNENIVVHNSRLCCPSPTCSEGINVIGDLDRSDSVVGVDRDRDVNGKGVFLAVLKMFLVVILALGTTRLTVGITLSAFLLFFLDSVGKRGSGFLNSCSEAKRVLRLVGRLFRFKKDKMDQKKRGFVMQEIKKENSCSYVMNYETRCPVQEIQLVEPVVEEIRFESEIMGNSDFEVSFKYQETELNDLEMEKEAFLPCGVGELKRKKSRKDKIKSKVKKLMPKKIRNSKKKELYIKSVEIFSEDNVTFSQELEGESVSRNLSSVSSRRYKDEFSRNDINVIGGLSDANEELAIKREDEESKGMKNVVIWQYLVLCLIVLIGLIGGRAFALLLTLSWCLLLKFGETY